LNQLSRPANRPALRLFLLAAFVLLFFTACGGRITSTNWAGLSTDGRSVYLATGPGVLAYDTETQAENWIFPAEPQNNLQFYSAPSIEDGRVIFGDYGQSGGFFSPRVTVSVYGLEDSGAGSPQELWTNTTAAADKIVAPTLQVENRVYVGTADNHVLALDATNGSEVWDFKTGHAIWGQPAYRDGVLYVASMDWSVYALDADSGTLIWSTRLDGALPSRVILGDSLLYVSSFDSNVHALDIATGEQRWAAPAGDWVWGAPALAEGVIYFSDIDGNLFAVDAENGSQLWTKSTGAAVQTSPIFHDNVLYVAAQVTNESNISTGSITAYSAADGEQIWQQQTTTPLGTNPVIVGEEAVVVALQNADSLLTAYDLATGQELWRYAAPES
jgi:outer membrane protein assembly factor BamB